MLQSFQFSALAALLQSLRMRYVILFAIGLVVAFVLPMMALSMTSTESSMPFDQMIQGIDPTNMAVSLTHQEPNFYQ
jgi:hypothetical protein